MKEYRVKVEVKLKPVVLDPQGKSVLMALNNLGYGEVVENLTNDDDDLGIEVNAEINKQVTENLSLGGRAAYAWLGDHYEGDPDDLYAFQLLVGYSF